MKKSNKPVIALNGNLASHKAMLVDLNIRIATPSVVSIDTKNGLRLDADYFISSSARTSMYNLFQELYPKKFGIYDDHNKREQLVTLTHFGIPTPAGVSFIPNFNNESFDYRGLVHSAGIADDEMVVVKDVYGANGEGQLCLEAKRLGELMDAMHSKDTSAFIEQYVEVGGDPNSSTFKSSLSDILNGDQIANYWMISKKIVVKDECRLIMAMADVDGKHPHMVAGRNANSKNGWQSSAALDDVTDHHDISKKVLDGLSKLTKHLGWPFVVFDLYKTHDGDWGVFEYSASFGYRKVAYDPAKRVVEKGFQNYMKTKFNIEV